MSLAFLTSAYQQQGQYTKAEKIEVEMIQLQKEVLGERHPDTIESMVSLVSIYHKQGRLEEAEELKMATEVMRIS